MGTGARAQVVDEVDASGHRGGKADAVVGAEDVVVHGLRYRHDGNPLAVKPFGVAKGVVPPDRDQRVDPQVLQVFQDVAGEVVVVGCGGVEIGAA